MANSTEATKEDDYRSRHTLPRTHRADNALHSIDEDKVTDRKELISALGSRLPTDKLTLYIRKPNETTNGDKKSNLGTIFAISNYLYRLPTNANLKRKHENKIPKKPLPSVNKVNSRESHIQTIKLSFRKREFVDTLYCIKYYISF